MSSRPRLAPPAATTQRYPMTPAEARDIASLQAQQRALEGALGATVSRAGVRIGLTVDAKVRLDMETCEYVVEG